jgi:hypothetical protein
MDLDCGALKWFVMILFLSEIAIKDKNKIVTHHFNVAIFDCYFFCRLSIFAYLFFFIFFVMGDLMIWLVLYEGI